MNIDNMKTEVIKGLPSFLMGAGGAFGLKATIDGVRSTFKATEDGYDRGYFLSKEVPVKEKLKVVGKYYWHVGVELGIAGACFTGAACGYKAQIANATAVAAYFERELREYRKKTKEFYGDEGDRMIQHEVDKEKVKRNPPPERKNSDAFLIFDPVTEQYFEATQKELDHVEHQLNRMMCKECPIKYNYVLRLFRNADAKNPIADEIGWFLDETYYEYHYYNESFFSHPLVEIYLDRQETANGDIYILRFSEEPMLNLELDADVVKDSQDVHGL